MEIPIQAQVICSDGLGGRSKLVIINPISRRVTNIVVEQDQQPRSERLVPIRYVIDTDDDLILLSCSRRQMGEMREFSRIEFVEADNVQFHTCDPFMLHAYVVPKWVPTKFESILRGDLEIRRGASVRATDGRVGRVDEFLIEPATGNITHLIMREGQLWDQKEIAIPISAIDRVEQNTLFLNLERSMVKDLPFVPVKRWW